MHDGTAGRAHAEGPRFQDGDGAFSWARAAGGGQAPCGGSAGQTAPLDPPELGCNLIQLVAEVALDESRVTLLVVPLPGSPFAAVRSRLRRGRGPSSGRLMLLAGPGLRADAHRCRARMPVLGAEEVAADETVEADQLGAGRRRRGRRQDACRSARDELPGKVLDVVPVQDEPPFAFASPGLWFVSS
jgi:hypothetical protein